MKTLLSIALLVSTLTLDDQKAI